MNSTDVYWEVDGESLQTYAHNIVSWGGDREAPPSLRGGDLTIPYAPGRTWLPRTPDSRTVTLGMWVTGANPDGTIPADGDQRALFEKNWKALRRLLWTPRRQISITKRFRLFGDSTIHTATAKGQFVSGLNPTMNGAMRAAFTVDILLSDPYFYGEPIELELSSQEPVKDFEILGDDRTMRIDTEITGYVKKLRITNEVAEELWFEYDRELTTGKKALIRNAEFEATHDLLGTPVSSSGSINHKGDPFWMYLEPGINRLGMAELDIPSRGVAWTNLHTNPSFETASGTTTLATNSFPDPSMETAATSGTEVWRTNLVPNPKVGTDTTGWSAVRSGGGVTGARVATGGPAAAATFYRVSLSSVLSSNISITSVSNVTLPVNPSGAYTASAYVHATKNPIGGVQVNLDWYALDGTYISSTQGTLSAISANEWERRSVTGIAPATAVWARVSAVFSAGSNLTTSDTVSATAFLLERSSVLRPYFDGSFATVNGYDAVWTGTANASTSELRADTIVQATNLVPNSSFEAGTSASRNKNQAINSSAEYVNDAVINYAGDSRAISGSPTNWGTGAWDDAGGGMGSGGITTAATGGPLANAPSYGYWDVQPTQYIGLSYRSPVLPAGRTYRYSYYVYTTATGTTLRRDVLHFAENNTGSSIRAEEQVIATQTANTWVQISGTVTVSADAPRIVLRPVWYRTSGSWVASQFRMSAVMITELHEGEPTTNPDYFDGDTADTASTGYGYRVAGDVTSSSIAYPLSNRYVNEVVNPAFASASAPTEIRRNRIRDPRGQGSEWVTPSGTAGTWTKSTPASGGPVSNIPYVRYTCSTVPTASPTPVVLTGSGAGTTHIAVLGGVTYTASVYARSSVAGKTFRVAVEFFNSSGTSLIVDGETATTLTSSWTRFKSSVTAPASAAYAKITAQFNSLNTTTVVGSTIDVSAAMLEDVAVTPMTYFDGSTSAAMSGLTVSWSGTVNASSSIASAPIPNSVAASTGTSRFWQGTGTDPYAQDTPALISLATSSAATRAASVTLASYTASTTYTVKLTLQSMSDSIVGKSVQIYLRPNQTSLTGQALAGTVTLGPVIEAGTEYTFTVTTTSTAPTSPGLTIVLPAPEVGDLLLISNALVTKVPSAALSYKGPYFPNVPVSTDGLVISNWLGAANASASEGILMSGSARQWINVMRDPELNAVETGATNVVRKNLIEQSDFSLVSHWLASGFGTSGAGTNTAYTGAGPYASGMYEKKWTTAGSGTGIGWSAASTGRIPVGEGIPVTVSAYVYCDRTLSAGFRAGVRFLTEAGTPIGSYVYGASSQLVADNWIRVSVTATAPATATQFEYSFDNGTSVTFPVGTTLTLSAPLAEWSPNLEPFFWGDAPDAEGYQYAWESNVGNSDSIATSGVNQTRVNYAPTPSVTATSGVANFVAESGGGTSSVASNSGFGRYTQYFARQSFTANATGPAGMNQLVTSVAQNLVASARISLRSSRAGDFRIVLDFLTSADALISSSNGPTFTLVANRWSDLKFENFTTPATTNKVRVRFLSVGTLLQNGDTLDADALTFTPAPVVGEHISDDLPPRGDFSVRAVSGQHREYSRAPLSGLSVGSASTLGYGFVNSSGSDTSGRKVLEFVQLQPGDSYWRWSGVLPRGKTITVRAKGEMPAGTYSALSRRIVVEDFAGTVLATSNILSAGTTGLAEVSFTAPSVGMFPATNVKLYAGLNPGGSSNVRWSELEILVGDSVYRGPFVGRSTARSSSEYLLGIDRMNTYNTMVAVSSRQPYEMFPSPDSTVSQTTDWSLNRAHSVEIVPASASSETYVELGNGIPGMKSGLVAGQTYTFKASINLDGAQAGTLSTYARTLTVVTKAGASAAILTSTTAAPNAAGTTELTLTLQIPANATEAAVRLYNGASLGNGVVRWDNIMVVPSSASTPYAEPYFDGLTADGDDLSYDFLGERDQSVSDQTYTAPTGTSYIAARVTARLSDVLVNKGKSLRLTPTSPSTSDGYISIGGDTGGMRLGMVAGKTYTLKATRYMPAPLTGSTTSRVASPAIIYKQGAGAYQFAYPPTSPNTSGKVTHVLTVTLPSDTTEAFVRLLHGGLVGSGEIWFDDVLLQETAPGYTGDPEYFDGETSSDSDYVYEWTGTRFESTSERRSLRSNLITATQLSGTMSSRNVLRGDTSLRVTAPVGTTTTDTYATMAPLTLTTNTQYLIRGKITLEAPLTGTLHANSRSLRLLWSTGLLTPTWEQTVPNAAGTHEYLALVTTPGTGSATGLRAYVGTGFGGGSIWVEDIALIPNGIASSPFFDGETPDTSEYTYSWTGTANNSSSTKTAQSVAGVTTGRAAAVSSTSWAKYGSRSLEIVALDPLNADSYAQIAPQGGWQSGKSYTVLGTLRLAEPQSGATATARARRIVMFHDGVEDVSAEAPNAAGEYELRVTFTVANAGAFTSLRLYNGGLVGNSVWWDGVAILETDGDPAVYGGPYFDGDTPDTDYADYEWTGTPNASTSVVKGLATTEPVIIRYQPAWL